MSKREANNMKGKILEDKILKRYIIEVLDHYHANIAIVDNIKYEYNPVSETFNVIEFDLNGALYFNKIKPGDIEMACQTGSTVEVPKLSSSSQEAKEDKVVPV